MIELILQLSFLSLPQAITQRMPQYPERYGIKFNTVHGAREYPAKEHVDIEINQYSGDLFQVSCLSPKDAIPLEPYHVAYERDNHGFRNTEPWKDDVDIVIIGDSFTAAESIQTPYWENLSDDILVLGLPGSGTLEQKLLFEHFGTPRSPEIVILSYFAGNDLTDSLTFYELQQANLTFADKTRENRSPLEYLVTFHLLLFIRDTFSGSSQADCHYPIQAQTQPPTPVVFFDQMVSTLTLSKEEVATSTAFNITQEAITELAETVKADGGKFILVYIPQKAEVYWNLLDEASQNMIEGLLQESTLSDATNLDLPIHNNLNIQRELLQDEAEDNNFVMLDLTPFLINAVEDGEQPYFFSDTHWNQVGHDIARRAIMEYLSKTELD